MRRFLWPIPLALAITLWGADISSKTYLDEVRYLASPELKGRATGSPELEKAAQYIAGLFKSFGLKPADGKNFEEAFPVTLGAHDGPGTRFRYREPEETRNLNPVDDFTPIGFSSNGKFAGGLVFAGYGVTDKEKNYDDYESVDVKDKLVLILRHEPNEIPNNPHGLSSHATFAEKAVNAKMHGAKGVILINDIYAHDPDKEGVRQDKLTPIGLGEGPTDAGIFFVQVKDEFAEKWIRDEGKDLHDLTDGINKDKKPQSFPMTKLYVDMDVDIRHDIKTV